MAMLDNTDIDFSDVPIASAPGTPGIPEGITFRRIKRRKVRKEDVVSNGVFMVGYIAFAVYRTVASSDRHGKLLVDCLLLAVLAVVGIASFWSTLRKYRQGQSVRLKPWISPWGGSETDERF